MDEGQCRIHDDETCTVCAYYEYTLEIDGAVDEGRFWVGQNVSITKGYFGDGVTLTYHRAE